LRVAMKSCGFGSVRTSNTSGSCQCCDFAQRVATVIAQLVAPSALVNLTPTIRRIEAVSSSRAN
jgi:hypothetical protein